jgi:hypothetical protein
MQMLVGLWNDFGHWWIHHRFEVWVSLISAAVVASAYAVIAGRAGPRDSSSNGITIGRAKQFDNRSLSLVLEELNASLEKLSVLSQSIASRADVFQESEETAVSRSISFALSRTSEAKSSEGTTKRKTRSAAADAEGTGADRNTKRISEATDAANSKGAADPDSLKFSPTFGMAAGDLLTDQVNLLYQIVNLRLLNERALSDRLRDGEGRLQAVLGFQVSINPPSFAHDCVAEVEIELLVPNATEPISVVAMIPQEKTYNAATLSSSADSLYGSVVSSWRLGAGVSRRRNAVYLHRDTDTIAFERTPGWYAGAFGWVGKRKKVPPGLAALGWEFRPVLGRRSVSPGARWMLAVVSLPQSDPQNAQGPRPILGVRTRTFWRRYHRRRQTTSMRLGLWPLPLFGPRTVESVWYDLPILRTSDIEDQLSPKVSEVSWADAGGGVAVVLVRGENFFSGTEVTIGGALYRAGDGNLVLKSHRAMEIHTTIVALATGDAVLSGRYGASRPLLAEMTGHDVPPDGVNILGAARLNNAHEKFSWMEITLSSASGSQLSPAIFNRTPQTIICVDETVVSQPYYFNESADNPNEEAGNVIVGCFVPTDMLAGAKSVSFKTPFLGANWAPSAALPEDRVTVVSIRAGVLIFTGTLPFDEPAHGQRWLAILDQEYSLDRTDAFIRLTPDRLKLTVPPEVIASFQKVHLSLGGRSYLLDVPQTVAATERPSLDTSRAPPVVKKGTATIVDFEGAGLTHVDAVKLGRRMLPHQAYADGSRLRVFLDDAAIDRSGKFDLTIRAANDELIGSIYVLDEPQPAVTDRS